MTGISVSSVRTRLCEPVDISGHRNNTAISAATETRGGAFNVWGNSFAAEYLPAGKSLVHVDGVPFDFPPVCDGPDYVTLSKRNHARAMSALRTTDTDT